MGIEINMEKTVDRVTTAKKKCGTCYYYQVSPLRGQGWCRNPALRKDHERTLVNFNELACYTSFYDFWEPAIADDEQPLGGPPTIPARSAPPARPEPPSSGGPANLPPGANAGPRPGNPVLSPSMPSGPNRAPQGQPPRSSPPSPSYPPAGANGPSQSGPASNPPTGRPVGGSGLGDVRQRLGLPPSNYRDPRAGDNPDPRLYRNPGAPARPASGDPRDPRLPQYLPKGYPGRNPNQSAPPNMGSRVDPRSAGGQNALPASNRGDAPSGSESSRPGAAAVVPAPASVGTESRSVTRGASPSLPMPARRQRGRWRRIALLVVPWIVVLLLAWLVFQTIILPLNKAGQDGIRATNTAPPATGTSPVQVSTQTGGVTNPTAGPGNSTPGTNTTPSPSGTAGGTRTPSDNTIRVGDKVLVANTDGDGVQLRPQPSQSAGGTRNPVVAEGRELTVLAERENEGAVWYQLRGDANGQAVEGWVKSQYLVKKKQP